MATWSAPLPPNDVVAGDPGHPEMHNQLVDAITEARANVDVAETTAAWATVTGKPTTFAPIVGTGATQAAAGNHTHAGLTADAAAGTASIRTLGTSATSAAAGDHTHAGLTAGAAGVATVRAIGTTATTAAAGNHTHAGLLAGTAPTVADSAATDVAGLVADYNALLAALRTRGVLSA